MLEIFDLVSTILMSLLTHCRFQILFAEIMNEVMRDHIHQVCGGSWNKPIATGLAILPKAAHHTFPSESTTSLCKWIEDRYAKLAVQVFNILDESPGVKISWSHVDKWKEMSLGYLGQLHFQLPIASASLTLPPSKNPDHGF